MAKEENGSGYPLAKLFSGERSTFKEWKEKMIHRLCKNQCFTACTSKGPDVPVLGKDVGTPEQRAKNAAKYKIEMKTYQADLKTYDERSEKAFGLICEGIESRLFDFTWNDQQSGYILWEKLAATYNNNSKLAFDQIQVRRTLAESRMPVDDHFDYWIAAFLKEAKSIELSEADTVTLLVSGILPDRIHKELNRKRLDSDTPMKLDALLAYAQRCDEQYFQDNPEISNSSNKRKRVATVSVPQKKRSNSISPAVKPEQTTCVNCYNAGHKVEECKSFFCRFCHTERPAHGHPSACPNYRGRSTTSTTSTPHSTTVARGKGKVGKQSSAPKVGHFPNRKLSLVSDMAAIDDSRDYNDDFDFQVSSIVARVLEQLPRRSVKRVLTHHINIAHVNKKESQDNRHGKFKLDSGAEVTCCNQLHLLTDVKKFTSRPLITVANGASVGVTAIGRYSNIYPVYYSSDLTECLLSTDQLSLLGYWTIYLPTNSRSNNISAYVCDSDGMVIFEADLDGYVDAARSATQSKFIQLPKKHEQVEIQRIRCPGATYVRNVEDLVMYWHGILNHASKTVMIAMAKYQTLEGFDLTEQQISKYWCQCMDCVKGKLRQRSLKTAPLAKRPDEVREVKGPARSNGFKKKANRMSQPDATIGTKICSDLYGPFSAGIDGRKYGITFIDQYSGYLSMATCATKTYLYKAVENVIQLYESAGHHKSTLGAPIEFFQSDAEAIYRSEEIQGILRKQGIKLQYSAPYLKQQNGVAERSHLTLGNSLAVMFAAAPWMPMITWSHAIQLAVYCSNILPKISKDPRRSAYEVFFMRKPSAKSLRLLNFGQPLEFHVHKDLRDWRGAKHTGTGAYLHPCFETKGAIVVWHFASSRARIVHTWVEYVEPPAGWLEHYVEPEKTLDLFENEGNSDLALQEEDLQFTTAGDQSATAAMSEAPALISSEAPREPEVLRRSSRTPASIYFPPDVTIPSDNPALAAILPTPVPILPAPASTTPSERAISVEATTARINSIMKRLHSTMENGFNENTMVRAVYKVMKAKSNLEPTMKQALAGPDWRKWQDAIDSEYRQLELREVFHYVDVKPDVKSIVGSFFVLKAVLDAEGNIVKYKARLVALGSNQSETTYDQVRSPTSRTSTVKLLINLSTILGRKCKAYDVPGAYLHSKTSNATSTPTDPNIHIRLPNGKLARLKKFIYGLKQAGLEWYTTHKSWILSLGFRQSTTEPCLYLWRENKEALEGAALEPGERYVILLVYVDDDLVLASDHLLDQWFNDEMVLEYGDGVKVKSESYTFLGMKVHYYENNSCEITMPAYCDRLVELAEMTDKKPASTPEITNSQIEPDLLPADKSFFQTLLGTINYLSLMCRHDLLVVVSKLSTCVSNPTQHDMSRLLRAIRYVKGTRDRGLVFNRQDTSPILSCFVDASFDCYPDSKSQTGYCFFLGDGSAAFFARSAKQSMVALSSAEAECLALFEAMTEIVWFRHLLEDIGFPQRVPTVVHEDNTATIAITAGHGSHSKTKHFDRRLNFNIDAVARGYATLTYCPTAQQVADILTKALSADQHEYLLRKLMSGETLEISC